MTDVVHTGNAQAVHQTELPLLAARLLGLGVGAMCDASGIACTQPQVTSIPSWTADAKGMLSAAPAYTALLAAQLAKGGLSGRRDLLENPLGYFYRVAEIGSPRQLEKAVRGLGTDWRFSAEHFDKRYPTDGFQLTAVHAMLEVRNQLVAAGIDPSDAAALDRIVVRIPLVMAGSATMFAKGKSDILDRVHDPAQPDWTYIALLFDGFYPLAAALLDGELTHRQYRDDRVADPRLRALFDKIEEVPDLSMGVFGADVTITAAGQDYRSFVACIRENVNAGFGADEKFAVTTEGILSPSRQQEILSAIDGLDGINDIRSFTALL